jgi:hypothetical protein
VRTLNSSVIPLGGLSVLLPVRPKKPTTTSSDAVVVSEGAGTFLLWGVNAPLCESTGDDFARPLKSKTAPAAAALDASDHA